MKIYEDEACKKPITLESIMAKGEENHGKPFWTKIVYDEPAKRRLFHNMQSALLCEDSFQGVERILASQNRFVALAS